MLSAFQPQPVHEFKPKDKSKIESLLAFGDRLLVGLSTGSLRIYRVNESSPTPSTENNGDASGQAAPTQDSPSKTRAVDLLREEEKFSRRPIQQLAIIKEANLLVSLSDGYVSLHDLQTYGLVERIERSKGANCFTVTSNVVKDAETNVPSLVSRLALAVKRKVLVWTWRDMELEETVVEMNTEASVKSLNWISGKDEDGALQLRLVVGMDAGFTVVNAEKPEEEAKPVYKPASRQDTTSGELAGVRFGAVSSSGMGYMGMGSWVPKPMATALADGQVMLAKDVNTLFTDLDGRPLEKRQVPWALAPEAVGFSYPYLLALQPPEKGTLQIRNPDTLSLLQTISVPSANILHVPQPNISLAHAGKGFLVASDRTIWRMNAMPYPSQLDDLVERARFDEAISLLNLLEDTLIDDKLGRLREVKIRKAIALFEQQKYRPALDLFTDAEAPPERVIRQYPRSIAGDLTSVPDHSTEDGGPGSGAEDEAKPEEQASREPPSTPQKGVLSKFQRSQTRRDSDAASIRTTTTAATPRTPAAAENEKDRPLEGDDLKFATRCLCSFLAQARVQIQKYLSTDGTLKQDPPELDSETNRPAFANLLPGAVFDDDKNPKHIDWQQTLLETAKLVDTTLFRAYMLALPSLAGPLFRLDNFCDPDVVQSSLYENDRYGDLIDFLHGKKLHRQALEMLQKFGKGSPQGEAGDSDSHAGGEGKDGALHTEALPEELKGPDRTVAYLRQLPPELIEIILEFVRWPLEVAPEKGTEVFLADTDYAERMPRHRVTEYLSDFSEQLEIQYLEHIINELGDQTPDFHQRLIDLYLKLLRSSDASVSRDQIKQKLEDFLRRSKLYNKSSTFRQLPTDDVTFFESRAIVLSAMGNHKQALAIYVFQLKDYAKAEDYCNRIYLSHKSKEHQETCLIDGITTHEKPHAALFEPEDSPDQPNVFAMLLGLYLRPPSNEEKRWPQALDLMTRHGARLPASSTLDLMPDDLAVSELQSYFRGRIRNATSILRQTSILKSLSAVQKVNTDRHWMLGSDEMVDEGKKSGRNRRVRITEEDHCRVCHKRFGASAVRVYPDNTVVHYGCVGKRPSSDVGGGGGRKASGHRGWG